MERSPGHSAQGIMMFPESLPVLNDRNKNCNHPCSWGHNIRWEEDLYSSCLWMHSLCQRLSMKWDKLRRKQTRHLAKTVLFQVLVDTLMLEMPNVSDALSCGRKTTTSSDQRASILHELQFLTNWLIKGECSDPNWVNTLWFFSGPKSEDDKYLLKLLAEWCWANY